MATEKFCSFDVPSPTSQVFPNQSSMHRERQRTLGQDQLFNATYTDSLTSSNCSLETCSLLGFFYLFFFFAPTRRVSLPWLTLVQPSKPFDAMYSLFMAVGFISVWVLFGSEFFFGFALVSYFLFFPFLSVPCFLRLLVCY